MTAERGVAPAHAARTARLIALPALSGVLIAATFLDFSLYPLAWPAFAPLLWSLAEAETRREALWIGLLAGMATNVPAFSWLVHTIHAFGGFPYPIAVILYLCLSAFAACQFVLFTLALRLVGPGPLGLSAPILWVPLELLFPNLFPWRLANSQLHAPLLTQIGDLTGPFGLSFVMVWFSAALVIAVRRPRRLRPLGAATLAAVLLAAYGVARTPAVERAIAAAPTVRVALIQGNIGIREKGNVAVFEHNIERYRALTEALPNDVDVIVWPESVAQWWVPAATEQLRPEQHPLPGLRTHLIFGGLAYASDAQGGLERYNSAFLIDRDATVLGRYDKRVLLPFGEYLPGSSWIPGLARLSPQSGHFTPGRTLRTLDVPGRARFAPLVCYEDVPSGIARAMTRQGAEVLLTLFNDAWFGDSAAPYQHEALALWRAIENRRYFVRVGNAGATGVIDPLGRVVSRLGLFTEGTLTVVIRPLRIETFYTRHGNVFGWCVVAAAFASLGLAWRRRQPSRPGSEVT